MELLEYKNSIYKKEEKVKFDFPYSFTPNSSSVFSYEAPPANSSLTILTTSAESIFVSDCLFKSPNNIVNIAGLVFSGVSLI